MTDNIMTFAKNFGNQVRMWNGVAATVNARLPNGVLVQGGRRHGDADAGHLRDSRDSCPSGRSPTRSNPYAARQRHATPNSHDQFKMLGVVHDSEDRRCRSAERSRACPGRSSRRTSPRRARSSRRRLGRPLAARRRSERCRCNLVEPGTMYGERLNQLDLRVARVIRFGRASATLNLDLYNALNVDTVLTREHRLRDVAAPAVDHAGPLREARVAAGLLSPGRVRSGTRPRTQSSSE